MGDVSPPRMPENICTLVLPSPWRLPQQHSFTHPTDGSRKKNKVRPAVKDRYIPTFDVRTSKCDWVMVPFELGER